MNPKTLRFALCLLLTGALAGCNSGVSGTPNAAPAETGSGVPSASVSPLSSSAAAESGTVGNPKITVKKKVDGVDLCGLLSTADIQEITGQPARSSRFNETRCNYTFGTGGTGPAAVSVPVEQNTVIVLGTSKNRPFELEGNTGIVQEASPAECKVVVFTAPWNRDSEPYGQGLTLTLTGFAPPTVNRCDLGMKMIKLMFDRVPAGG
ncbi:DUF3558 family protein [Amycolatopsis sp. H20-H5]|uniref:DUF3558 family protein n=1 Tax=Amycolatopsis sp. H20-H5 TaxID=3046309 RepID=UPI002DBF4F46|nr:DUF3558 family protein [Amycolatopsis sp. H20-H5]MEC3976206.1 DUF3558 family protein [Amycolatopsis sp. H20-H5]